jgi:cell division protein FtsW
MSSLRISTPGRIDWLIMLITAALLLFSVPFVYSASASFADIRLGSSEKLVWKHAIRVIIAVAIVVVFARIDYHVWKKWSKYLLYGGFASLVLVFFVGSRMKGASRWIHFGPINFQPSELAKFALVIYVAAWIADNHHRLDDLKKGLLPILGIIGMICGLIALQPNFSTASVIAIIMGIMLFAGNVRLKHLLAIGGITLIAGSLYAVSASYRMKRILAFLGSSDAGPEGETVNYQLQQALLALGNGGLLGVGVGQSHQRDMFLPESYGDFISSIIGEEYGFVGITMVLLCFTLILYRGLRIARTAPDLFGRMLALGITITMCIYAFVNAGVNCGLLPTTGLPMPFLSYGGSAVLFSAAAMGILLNISARSGMFPHQQKKNK